jgi:hypothetical protein
VNDPFEDTLREGLRDASTDLPEGGDPYARVTTAITADRRRRRALGAGGAALALAAAVAIGGAVQRGMASAELTPAGQAPEPTSTPTGTFEVGLGSLVSIASCIDRLVGSPPGCPPELEATGLANFEAAVAATTGTTPDSIEAEVAFNQPLPASVLPTGETGHVVIYQASLPSGKHVRATDAFLSTPAGGAGLGPYLYEVESPVAPLLIIPGEVGADGSPILVAPDAATVSVAAPENRHLALIGEAPDPVLDLRDTGEGVWSVQWLPPPQTDSRSALSLATFTVTGADGSQDTFTGAELLDLEPVPPPS